MNDDLREIEEIYHEALAQPVEVRAAWLRERCAQHPEVLRRVAVLLRYGEDDESWHSLAWAVRHELAGALGDTAPDLAEGVRIGPYRTIEELGRGGMGRVFLAEREDVGKRVAIKVVHGALASPDRLRRFRTEQRVLAGLEHAGIVPLIDVGVTDEGLPFFVMERVDGLPITQWIERTDASLEERLALLLEVCDAVQYAHRNLVVHRDIKPSNVLVTTDGRPKLLDFGVAKLMDEHKSETATETRVFTLAYAAPEQLTGAPVTTTTDVYQLGALLYEMLAGTPPFDVSALAPADAFRIITTTEPRPPSRVPADGSINGPAPRSASPPERVKRRARGDVDRIVLKCLAKEPAHRYASVEALAGDIRRFLDGHPIVAQPAGALYRARKFVRRHRVLSAACLVGVLYAGTVTVQNRAITRASTRAEREAATARRVSDFLVSLFSRADPREAAADTLSPLQLVETAAEQVREDLALDPEIRASMQEALGRVYLELGRYTSADSLLTEAVDVRRTIGGDHDLETARALNYLGEVAWAKGEMDRADSLNERVLAVRAQALGTQHEDYFQTLQNQGTVRYAQGRYTEAEQILTEAAAIARAIHDGPHEDLSMVLNNLANAIAASGRHEEAGQVMREALEVDRALYGGDHPDIALRLDNLAFMAHESEDYEEALRLGREALDMYGRVYTEPNPNTAFALTTVAYASFALGDTAAADSLHRAAVALQTELLGSDHADAIVARAGYAAFLYRAGRLEEAEQAYAAVVEQTARVLGMEHPNYAQLLGSHARVVEESGDASRARAMLEEAWQRGRESLGTEHPWVVETGERLQRALLEAGDTSAAQAVEAALPDSAARPTAGAPN